MSRVIVVGAGINGVTAAIELTKRRHVVVLVDPGPLPHPLAASTDISKAVRAAYGADADYTELAERSIRLWREWNMQFGIELYHEVGVMFVRQREMKPRDFELESFNLLKQRGHKVERMNSPHLWKRFPAWNPEFFHDGVLELHAGYAESGHAVAKLVERAKSLGVELRQGVRFAQLHERADRVTGIVCDDGQRIAADIVVMATGAWTPYLLPFTNKFFRASGQPVFHLKPRQPELFRAECFPVFGADITTTGYYGFPINRDGIVKIANHGRGREMSPDSAERAITAEDEQNLRKFLSSTFPALADAPIVYSRVCMYCDTHDGDFWISRDPERKGLIIAAGDCGHGFKFAPVLGEIIADAVEEKPNPILRKFRWRREVPPGAGADVARAKAKL
ncbi:MAG TPA: FAD-dependent oxidoreductase [Candidatus Udaeobacter sp.]|jgi:glycine/D-amino acid oxidase-like deaminating enzyme|nr:FAD-dependent oxidoreductase [Candidatus Udaeobacter sp.]